MFCMLMFAALCSSSFFLEAFYIFLISGSVLSSSPQTLQQQKIAVTMIAIKIRPPTTPAMIAPVLSLSPLEEDEIELPALPLDDDCGWGGSMQTSSKGVEPLHLPDLHLSSLLHFTPRQRLLVRMSLKVHHPSYSYLPHVNWTQWPFEQPLSSKQGSLSYPLILTDDLNYFQEPND